MVQRAKHLTSLLLSAGLVVGLGGCSTLEKHIPGIGAATSQTRGSAAAEGVYYVATPDLPLQRSPGGVIIKRLPKDTKVYRDQLERGFAHVRVGSTGETGWVENAQLTWRLPRHGATQQAHQPESQPAAESPLPEAVEPSPQPVEAPESPAPPAAEAPQSPSPQAVEPPPPSSHSPSGTPAKGAVAPSIFNPY